MSGESIPFRRGAIGILSDAHGNGPAFDRAIVVLKGLGAERFWFLGDAVGYIPSTSVIKSIRKLGAQIQCIRGNHEQMFIENSFNSERDKIYQLSALNTIICPDEKECLASWGISHTEKFGSKSALLVHGSPTDPTNGYIYPDTDLSVFETENDIVFMGHSHYPFIRNYNGKKYINVGSCGLPRDDGRYGSAAIFYPDLGEARVIRFNITQESATSLADNQFVHQAVRNLFLRRNENVFGEFV